MDEALQIGRSLDKIELGMLHLQHFDISDALELKAEDVPGMAPDDFFAAKCALELFRIRGDSSNAHLAENIVTLLRTAYARKAEE